MLDKNLKKYREMTKTKKWKENQLIMKKERERMEKEKISKKTPLLKEAEKWRSDTIKENGFTQFGFLAQATAFSKYYVKNINAKMAELSIGTPMWAAFEKTLYGNGEDVHFKNKKQVLSIVSDNKSGIMLKKEEEGKYYCTLQNNAAKAKPLKLYIKGPDTVYEKEMLKYKVKTVRIIKETVNGNPKFYAILSLEGAPYIKKDEFGNPLHVIKKGEVSLAVSRRYVFAVTKDGITKIDLVPNLSQFSKSREELSREIEAIRRENNPDNYQKNGRVKARKRDLKTGRKIPLRWNNPPIYYEKVKELEKVFGKQNRVKKILQDNAVWELLTCGDTFHFIDTSFLTKKEDKEEEKKKEETALGEGITEENNTKERRKSIQDGAPSALLTKLDNRLDGMNMPVIIRHKVPDKYHFYRHDLDVMDKDFFLNNDEEDITIDGLTLNKALYQAFLLSHYSEKELDKKAIKKEWPAFKKKVEAMNSKRKDK